MLLSLNIKVSDNNMFIFIVTFVLRGSRMVNHAVPHFLKICCFGLMSGGLDRTGLAVVMVVATTLVSVLQRHFCLSIVNSEHEQ